MKQLDDERCAHYPGPDTPSHSLISASSHSESFVGTTLRRLLPTRTSRTQTEGRDTREPRHDHPHNHAHPPTRSRSHGIQNEPRRPRWCFLCRYWWSWRASARTAGGASTHFSSLTRVPTAFSLHPPRPLAHTTDHRASPPQPRTLPTRRHFAPERCTSLWPTRDRQDATRPRGRRDPRDQLSQSRLLRYR